MTDDTNVGEARSIDTVIRGFTTAELALREVSGAVERIRSASEQLDEARNDQATVRAGLDETVSALNELGSHLEAVVGSLRESVEVLTSMQPDRLWRHLEAHADATANIERRIDALDAGARRTMWVAAIGLVVALGTLVVLIALVGGWLGQT